MPALAKDKDAGREEIERDTEQIGKHETWHWPHTHDQREAEHRVTKCGIEEAHGKKAHELTTRGAFRD